MKQVLKVINAGQDPEGKCGVPVRHILSICLHPATNIDRLPVHIKIFARSEITFERKIPQNPELAAITIARIFLHTCLCQISILESFVET